MSTAPPVPHVVNPAGTAMPRFMLAPLIPLKVEFLRGIQHQAVNDARALPVWAENFSGRPAEEAVYFDEKEWRGLNPAPRPHRIDLYGIQRGLLKVFDAKYNLSITSRQIVFQALYDQGRYNILLLNPNVVSEIIQLALFDQVIYS